MNKQAHRGCLRYGGLCHRATEKNGHRRAIIQLEVLAYHEGQRETRRAVLSTLFLFGLITWLYEVTVRIAIPWWLSEPLNHINLFPFNLRVDLMGMVAFVVSAPAFFLQLTREREKNDCETSMY